MKALLLNSGLGRRMGPMTAEAPKCMCPIGENYTIIRWQLELLQRAGIREAVITTGPFADKLEAYVRECAPEIRFTFVPNPRYAETNYIYSMALAADVLKDSDILLLHGDLVLEPGVIEDLMAAEHSVIAVDKTLPLPEKDFKAKITAGQVQAVGIHYFGSDCEACQAAYKWQKQDFSRWMEAIQSFCREGKVNVYSEEAFNAFNGSLPLFPLEMNGRLCSEIDNADDLDVVSARFLQIHSGERKL